MSRFAVSSANDNIESEFPNIAAPSRIRDVAAEAAARALAPSPGPRKVHPGLVRLRMACAWLNSVSVNHRA
jgi:hypothetical protein